MACDAKILLAKDIREGTVIASMGPKDVYGMHEEYQQYPYTNFRTNLCNLRKSIQKLQGHANEDSAALAHDLKVRPRVTKMLRGLLRLASTSLTSRTF